MSTPYTPSTVEVRSYATQSFNGYWKGMPGEDFDRWLEAHDRQVAAAAWDKAVQAMQYEDGTPVEIVQNSNPYRGLTQPHPTPHTGDKHTDEGRQK